MANTTDDDGKDLKNWVIKKLEDISDADSDVLADYVLALIRADTPEADLKANAIENLEDFLRENTISFVDELFLAINTKSYIPGYVPPQAPTITPTQPIPSGPSNKYGSLGGRGDGGFQQSRKRSYNDMQPHTQGYDPHYGHHDRQMKQMRRGGMNNGSRGGFQNPNGSGYPPQPPFPGPQMPGFLSMPAGAPPMSFDPNDPMAAMIALQALGMPLPPVPGTGPPGFVPPVAGKTKIDARCRDYDIKGICERGIACPFNHGDDQIFIPPGQQEYDPKNAGLVNQQQSRSSPTNGHSQTDNSRGRGRGRGDRGNYGGPRRNNRADFSQAGPNTDKSLTTVVVEQIPEENFDEKSVTDFFSVFGSISEVTLQPYKRLALVKFEDYHAARAAYESPRVIFDNRFVKVYWYNPNLPQHKAGANGEGKASSPTSATNSTEPAFDREEFERSSQAAQKKLEERKALQQQNEVKKAELEKAKKELEARQAAEKQKLLEKLKAKGLVTDDVEMSLGSPKPDPSASQETSKTSAQTEALRAQLKALEDEARSLGIDPHGPETYASTTYSPRGRGRGRARGGYRGYPGGYDPNYRGRGRGVFQGTVRAGGAFNLDNRPRRVKVDGVEWDDEKEENLKQYLISVGDFISLSTGLPCALANATSSVSSPAKIITFKDRNTAERFFYGTKDIPGVGTGLEYSWAANAPIALSSSVSASGGNKYGGEGGYKYGEKDGDTEMAEAVDTSYDAEEDFDVA